MMMKGLFAFTLFLVLPTWSRAEVGNSNKESPRVVNPHSVGVGRRIADGPFQTIAGQEIRLSKISGPQGLVIALTNTTCPLCKKYASTLAQLEPKLKAKGLALLLLNPTEADQITTIQEWIQQHGIKSSYVISAKLAQQLQATTTTEVFLLDKSLTLVYRGAIDDQYGLGYSLDAPKRNYLNDAIQCLLAGRKPDPAATTAPGCVLDLPKTTSTSGDVTYHNRISRIIQNHCLDCHREGGVGPFKLETYEDVVAQAGMIRRVVEKGTMPPWFARPSDQGETTHWANDRTIPQADKDDLFAWLKSSRPIGDPADAPLPRKYESGWLIGKPDQIFEFKQAVQVKANGTMPYQNVIIDTRLAEDKWVRAVEIRPSAPAVVHHVLVFALAPGESEKVEDERMGFFAAYVPGHSYFSYPAEFAKKLPKGTRLKFQMHYTPNGTATEDKTQIGIIYADQPPQHEIRVVGIANPQISIPPGAPNHREVAALRVPSNATILAFMPHMHLRGKAFKYEITPPKGETKTILNIPQYDFNWQLYYRLAEPMLLTAGTEIKATAWYDNSADNPANPDPTKRVYWGPQTFDEMMLGYIEYYVPKESTSTWMTPRPAIDAELLLKRIDLNNDGKVTTAEVEAFFKTLPRFRGNPEQIDQLIKQIDANKDGIITVDELRKLPGVK